MSLSERLHYAIEEVDLRALSDEDIARRNALGNILQAEAHPDDPPDPVERTAAWYRNVPDSMIVREFWARETDGSIVAAAEVTWTNTDENPHLMRSWIGVRPDLRRRGIGTALLRLMADVGAETGRNVLAGMASSRVPSGDAFAQRIGAEAAQAVHTNRLLIAEVDTEMIDRWIAHGPERAPGYSLLAIDGPAPEDHLDDVVSMYDVMNTAPRDDLDMEDERTLPEHVREWERIAMASGDVWWSLYARQDDSPGFVGYTHVSWNPAQPETVFQYGTAVRPEHRGHALGKWLKATMLRRIIDERPGVVDVRTGNADSNDPMLGINRGLGFRPYIAQTWWQVKLDTVQNYLEAK